MATQQKQIEVVGTGKDPLGRFPVDQSTWLPTDKAAEAIESGYVRPAADVRAEEPSEPEQHVPAPDHSGAIQTDRPFTPDEAAALDARNRRTLIERRRARFAKRA
jgi:hypothetical protein